MYRCRPHENGAVTEKPNDAVVKFDTYRNLQRHRAVLPAIARLLFSINRNIQPDEFPLTVSQQSAHRQYIIGI